ncbi:hypothetical protein [Pseudomonas chlororaphis]|uniref:hypothetical protein n=1 Tax=Pseudomonas chlororaphis TaxID=587753 RepID=UPI001186BBCA|nr:hypothetical protein [Pseudomonas chlororaphis]
MTNTTRTIHKTKHRHKVNLSENTQHPRLKYPPIAPKLGYQTRKMKGTPDFYPPARSRHYIDEYPAACLTIEQSNYMSHQQKKS